MNRDDSSRDDRGLRGRVQGGPLIAGLILIGLGTCFLLYELGMIDFAFPWRWWPLILVAIGAGKAVTANDGDEVRGGVWMILVGTWLLTNFQNWFGLSWQTSWPLMIVAAGLMIAWNAWSGDGGSCGRRCRTRRRGAAAAGGAGEEAR